MYCYQCKQDSYARLCRVKGLCAKDPACSAVEEYMLQGLKSISIYAKKILEFGGSLEGFSNVATKVFSLSVVNLVGYNDEIIKTTKELALVKENLKIIYDDIMRVRGFQIEVLDRSLYWQPKYDINEMIREGEKLSLFKCRSNSTELNSLERLLIESIRGMVRYVFQAKTLGFEDEKITRFLVDVLYSLTTNLGEENLKEQLDYSGKINLLALKLVEKGLFNRYGVDDISKIRTSPVKGKAVLVSGQDLKDLEDILKATVSKNINVYTHGEMMLAHAFPELRAFPNLIGNYGGISVDQQTEVESFPGAVLVTSNSFWDPPEVYRGRIFTTGLPGWPGIKQICDQDFSPIINAALDSEGFKEDYPECYTEVGFDYERFYDTLANLENGVEKGIIKHVFLIVGCSSSLYQKDYIKKFMELVPKNCVVIKFAGFSYDQEKNIEHINGVPRVLEFGLFDDLLSVIKIFASSQEKLQAIINSEKFSTVFFLRDQSAISVLLSVLQFKKENVKIGSCMPSLISPVIYRGLDRAFSIKHVSTPEEDIKEFLYL